MKLIPNSFMEIVEEGAISIGDEHNTSGKLYFPCESVDDNSVHCDAKYTVTNCFHH